MANIIFFGEKPQSPFTGIKRKKEKIFHDENISFVSRIWTPKNTGSILFIFFLFFFYGGSCVCRVSINFGFNIGGNPRFISGGGENLDLRTYTIYVPAFLLSTSCLEQRQYRVDQKQLKYLVTRLDWSLFFATLYPKIGTGGGGWGRCEG